MAAETFVSGGLTGGPGQISGFIDAAGYFKQKITLSPQQTDTDPLVGSPTTAGALLTGVSRQGTLGSPVLTRPANTTPYSAGTLVASSTASGSIIVPSFQLARANGGSGTILRLKLWTNAIAGMNGVTFMVDIWNAFAPTFAVGDGGIYGLNSGIAGIATQSLHWVGSFTFPGMRQMGDGATMNAASDSGQQLPYICDPSSNVMYWTLMTISGFTPVSSQQFACSCIHIED